VHVVWEEVRPTLAGTDLCGYSARASTDQVGLHRSSTAALGIRAGGSVELSAAA